MRLIRFVIASLLLGALSACGAASVIGPTATPAPPPVTPTPLDMSGRIAYVTRDSTAIRTVLPDGTDDRALTAVVTQTGQLFTSLSASPDGQFLAYSVRGASGNSTMTVLRPDGSVVREYQSTGAPQWSPDGAHFAAQVIDSESPLTLHVVYPSGSDQTVTPLARFDASSSGWFPDGKRLAYVRDNAIYALDLASAESQLLSKVPPRSRLDWRVQDIYVQPDGERIWAYAGNFDSPGADGMRWWSLPAAGGELKELIERRSDFIGALDLSPDGRTLAYVEGALASTCEAPRADELYLSPDVSAEQPAPRAAPLPGSQPYEIFGFAWEAGGRRLAFAAQAYDCQSMRRIAFPAASIYVWPVDGAQPPARIAEGAYPAWLR